VMNARQFGHIRLFSTVLIVAAVRSVPLLKSNSHEQD
jgi:hypothetical protein